MKRASGKSQCAGFSLLELMIVMAIFIALLGASVATFQKSARASNVVSAGEIVVGNLSLAQQIANTYNRQVEIRFYRMPDDNGAMAYRAFQLFRIETSGTKAATKPIRFPQSVVLASAIDKTSILTLTPQTADASSPKLPRVGTNYQYVAFQFKPTGDIQPPSDNKLDTSSKWFLTLILDNDPIKASGLPANFLTIQIDPVSGKTSVFRP
jgi:uncharacterized protein (TIGR02596 family)